MAKRGRPKKRKDITIESDETKIFIGLIFLSVAVLLAGSPYFDGKFFEFIMRYIGQSTYIGAFFFLALAVRLFGYKNWLTKLQTIIGVVLIWVSLVTFLHFTIPIEQGKEYALTGEGGGLIGYLINLNLQNWFDRGGELVILIVFFIVAVSIFINMSLKNLIEFVEGLVNQTGDTVKGLGGNLEQMTKKLNDLELNKKDEATDSLEDDVSDVDKSDRDTMFSDDTEDESTVKEKNKTQKSSASGKPSKDKAKSGDDSLETETIYDEWEYPPVSLLNPNPPKKSSSSDHEKNADIIVETLKSFNINSKVVDISRGPTVIQYALKLSTGTKVSKISNLSQDIATALAAPGGHVRVQTPIPGTSYVGIEVPRKNPELVNLRAIMNSDEMENNSMNLPLILGKDVSGDVIIEDLTKMPHMLIAGATGSGKSVAINAFITGLTMTLTPDKLQLILVDPKTVEFSGYEDIPHLLTPVITEVEKVVNTFAWTVEEMQDRYKKLKDKGARNIKEYNKKMGRVEMPYIVIIIDEMADLMLSTGADVENKIVRLAQMARAVGIHLVLATQRPSVNVITGLIKANIPARIALAVSTSVDSRVVLDQVGAEDLLGNGDMLYKSPDRAQARRIQGVFASSEEIKKVVEFLKQQGDPNYKKEVYQPQIKGIGVEDEPSTDKFKKWLAKDPKFVSAIKLIVSAQKGSISYLQTKLKIGYNRAARYVDRMEEMGVVGESRGSKARKVLVKNADEYISKIINDELD
jgi:S-DNA-T family DNA segregation ATPase FtsK/SpoIIIE